MRRHTLRAGENALASLPEREVNYLESVEARLREFCEPFAHELGVMKAHYDCVESAWRGKGSGQAIVDFVKGSGCDLVVLGTRAKWNLRDFLWGSTAERVVRSVGCSILAVKLPLVAGDGVDGDGGEGVSAVGPVNLHRPGVLRPEF